MRGEIKGTEIKLAQRNERIASLEQDLQAHALQISALTTELARSEQLRRQSEAARLLLKVNHRAALMEVLEQGPDPTDPEQILTRVRFVELDAAGKPAGTPQEITVQGTRVYLESLVIKFDDTFVEGGDALRGTSVCLFKKMFGENTPPNRALPSMR